MAERSNIVNAAVNLNVLLTVSLV